MTSSDHDQAITPSRHAYYKRTRQQQCFCFDATSRRYRLHYKRSLSPHLVPITNPLFPEPLTKPNLSATSVTAIGRIETIKCRSKKGYPPISYALFHNGDFIANVTRKKHGPAAFNISIVNASSLGPYTCRASDGINTSSSAEFRFTLQESLGKPELKAESTLTAVGRTETLRCLCSSGSLPITYSLFKDRELKGIITVSEPREAVFNVTITDSGSIGVFKCKANHSVSSSAAYSKDFHFTLQ
ncbi:hypothetical protein FKM82_026013, partial [Ascaphus truei]